MRLIKTVKQIIIVFFFSNFSKYLSPMSNIGMLFIIFLKMFLTFKCINIYIHIHSLTAILS